jgi:hypothetical protein
MGIVSADVLTQRAARDPKIVSLSLSLSLLKTKQYYRIQTNQRPLLKLSAAQVLVLKIITNFG